MVRRGRHAADDGAFARSAGGAAVRGAGLLALAVLLGIVLLQSADSNDGFSPVATKRGGASPAAAVTTSTAPAPTTTTAPLRPPSAIKVLAANGTTIKGLAGKFKDRLTTAGYNALAPTDAAKKPVAASAVYYAAGYEGEAKAIARIVDLPVSAVKAMPQPAPVASTQGANVVVVVGNDVAATLSTTTTSGVKRSPVATTTTVATRRSPTTTRG